MRATVYMIKRDMSGSVAIVARPRGGEWLEDEIAALAREGIDVVVSMLTPGEARELGLENEREECEALSLRFISISIEDRAIPLDRTKFLSEARRIAVLVMEEKSVGIHCRASIGRATILAAAILIQLGMEADEAFAAVERARGCPVPDTPEQRRWVAENVVVGVDPSRT